MQKYIVLFLLSLFVTACSTSEDRHIRFDRLLCNYAQNPIGIDATNPQFSWVLSSNQRQQGQSAYRIILASSKLAIGKGDFLWDTGKVTSDQTMHHRYRGEPLESNTRYTWRVSIWDNTGNQYDSPLAEFYTALLKPGDWKANWIGLNDAPEPTPTKGFFMDSKEEIGREDTVSHHGRSILLRNEFRVEREIRQARLFLTGLGFYEAMINGRRVGNNVLAPAKTPYHKHILYNAYDVTDLLVNGENAIGIHVGNGWYNPYKKWWKEYRMQWFGYKKALAQLHITYQDGETMVMKSDADWKTTEGPVLFNCVYDGELYDANEELEGWTSPDFDDSDWKNVVVMNRPEASLISETMPAMQVIETRKPIAENKPKAGMNVYDLGQNFTGWIHLEVDGKQGDTLQIRFSEGLYDDGTLNFTCNERAKATIHYILKGDGPESYETTFSYFGFQFVEITSSGELPNQINLEGKVVHSANNHIGQFACSHELINKMHHATVWSQKSNMIGYPMDCPQRDERLGWLGDAQVTAEEAMFNFDMALFYTNFFRGLRANQDEKTGDIPIISPRPYIKDEGVEWSSSYLTMVWDYYRYYGDKAILEDNYAAMVRYLDYLGKIADNHIVPHGWIGDWGSMVEGWHEGEPHSVPTAYYFYNTTILKKIAEILDKPDDASIFAELAENIKIAYNENFLDFETNNYNDGSQMANAFPLFLGLVPDDRQEAVVENIVTDVVKTNETHLTTGVLGTKYLIEALTLYNRSDISWALATQTTYPSWAEMMKRFNTMCEFWTLKQSHNHVMMGSIDSWFFEALAGIRLSDKYPAFQQFVIKPYVPEDLDFINASTETLRGKVASSWSKENEGFSLSVEIPFNCSAAVHVPVDEGVEVFVDDIPADQHQYTEFIGYEDGYNIYNVKSGKYIFSY